MASLKADSGFDTVRYGVDGEGQLVEFLTGLAGVEGLRYSIEKSGYSDFFVAYTQGDRRQRCRQDFNHEKSWHT